MGLDMYLSKKTYVKNWDHQEKHHKITVEYDGKIRADIKPGRIAYIEEEIMYWRKQNAIHNWFVENCQEGVDDCREAYVSMDDIKKLADLCETVLESKEGALLPTSEGFFFGGTEYDEWYFEGVKETLKVLREEIESNTEDYPTYYYHSSW
jgi:hypothetical protein